MKKIKKMQKIELNGKMIININKIIKKIMFKLNNTKNKTFIKEIQIIKIKIFKMNYQIKKWTIKRNFKNNY